MQGSVIARFSTINISDGIVGSFMRAYDSTVNVSGGFVKDGFRAYARCIVNINGGVVKGLTTFSETNISGDGELKLLVANAGSKINVYSGTLG